MKSVSGELMRRSKGQTVCSFSAVSVLTGPQFQKGYRAVFLGRRDTRYTDAVIIIKYIAQQVERKDAETHIFDGPPINLRFDGNVVPRMLHFLEGNGTELELHTRYTESKLIALPGYNFKMQGRLISLPVFTKPEGGIDREWAAKLPREFEFSLDAGHAVMFRKLVSETLRFQPSDFHRDAEHDDND